MTIEQIIRAWKDPIYRASLSDAERAQLPEHPAGTIELTDAQLADVAGAARGDGLSIACTYTCFCTRPILCERF